MADKYASFSDLQASEREGVDFRIRLCRRSSSVAIIAPHGGKIERGTSEIAEAIAEDRHNLYCFEGTKSENNWDLHITSARFDEPKCVALVSACDIVVAVHGCGGRDQTIFLGGLDGDLRQAIRDRLNAAGFATGTHANLRGEDRANICNRGRRNRGVQLEITKSLRRTLVPRNPTGRARALPDLANLANAVRCAIEKMAGP